METRRLALLTPTLVSPPWSKSAVERAPIVVEGERVRSGGSLVYA